MSSDTLLPAGWKTRLLAIALRRAPLLRYALLRRAYLLESGWVASMRANSPVDAAGDPLAWYTYAALDFLGSRARADMDVFEYGAGHSTLWWAERVHSVRSVESDAGWVAQLRPRLPGNVELRHEALGPPGRYARAALDGARRFDVVVIDGYDRNDCARHGVDALKPGGVIVWDNADWTDRFAEGLDLLELQGFSRLDFSGLGPLNGYGWTTAVFYRRGANCLGI